MPIVQSGSINTTALVVPDIYVQIVPPQNTLLNGVPTNVVGVVGTASLGPVNQPTIVGSGAQYQATFGTVQPRAFDAGTQVSVAIQQGANNFRMVRVTDGSDTKAANVVANAVTFSSAYTGSQGNVTTVTLGPGSKPNSTKATVAMPDLVAEQFDNITGNTTSFWSNLATAINTGNGPLRDPSALISATATGTSPAPNAVTSYALVGGTDGVAGVNAATVVGGDGASRTGMYALRGQGCSIGLLADVTDSTQWPAASAFGLAESTYMVLAGPAGDTVANAVATRASAGIDSYAVKLMFGDYPTWSDPVNGVLRLVSPAPFVAGRLANLSPEQSSLNKPVYGIVNTQRNGYGPGNATYSSAELQALLGGGWNVICNPVPGGTYYGTRGGHNSSSNAATCGDNYTRLTNYIATTLNASMGQFVGQLINPNLTARVKAALVSYLQNMLGQGMLGSLDGSLPFSVICDASNNPLTRTALGYLQADVQVQYGAIVEKFLVNVEGGQSVVINRQTLPSGRVG